MVKNLLIAFAAVSLAAACIALAWPSAAVASPVACAPFITSHIAWMGTSTNRRIGAKFARVKITSGAVAPAASKWGHVSVSEGAFAWHGDEMSGRFLVAFNDRGFDPSKRDITDITLRADGTGEIVLRSWGNAKLVLSDLRCDSAEFLTAIESEGNGTSMITLSFRRETF
jgi:hypothetical protein